MQSTIKVDIYIKYYFNIVKSMYGGFYTIHVRRLLVNIINKNHQVDAIKKIIRYCKYVY